MKILCVIDTLNSGGAQFQLVELAIGFREKGNEVYFLIYHDFPFFNPYLERVGIEISCIKEPNYLKRLFKMRKFIRNGSFDAVLSFLEAPSFICEFSGLPFRKWKLVVGERSASPEILRSLKLKVFRWFHAFADYVVANSYNNLRIVRKINPLLSNTKCNVIYNAIDLNTWKPDPQYIHRKNGKTRLVVVARQIFEKNLNGLIEAIALLDKEDLGKITVDWYGDRITEPLLDSSITEAVDKINKYGLKNVIFFYPATHDIARIIKEADAIGLFSFFEGLPNSVCEGMACGKPIICSAVSDLPKLLSYDKRLLCDPEKPESIKLALHYLINLSSNNLKEIGSVNLETARSMFDKKEIVTKYLGLFN
jgi:glycosyltransferase involved in cell wall biosynthesis